MLEDLVVIRLLQNESHADVYLVQNRNPLSKFLDDGLSGNWSTFSRFAKEEWKMDRLRRSNGFHAETVQLGRKIIVMEGDSKDKYFHVKSMQREFPPLPRTGAKPLSIILGLLDIWGVD
jgi:hypothetical protein